VGDWAACARDRATWGVKEGEEDCPEGHRGGGGSHLATPGKVTGGVYPRVILAVDKQTQLLFNH